MVIKTKELPERQFGIDWKQKRYERAKRAKQKAEGGKQKAGRAKQKAECRKQKAERMEKPEAEGYREARRGWGREFTTHAITYILFCQVLL